MDTKIKSFVLILYNVMWMNAAKKKVKQVYENKFVIYFRKHI